MSELNVSNGQLSAPDNIKRAETYYLQSMVLALALLPLIGYLAPRTLSFLPGLIGLVGYFAGWYVYKTRPRLHKGALYIVMPLVVLALLSVTWAIDPEGSWKRALKMTPVLISGVVLLSVLQNYGARLLPFFIRLFPMITVFALVVALIDLMSHGALYSLMRGLPFDEDFNESHLNRGIIVLMPALIPVYAILKANEEFWNVKRTRLYTALILGVLGGVFLTTDSQSAHLIIVLCVIFWTFFPVSKRAAWYGLWFVFTALIFAAPWMVQHMFQVLPPLISDVEWFQQSYALNRLEIWDYLGRYIETNPLYGFGVEATRSIDDFDSAFLYDKKTTLLHPHNFALQLWIEFGVIGAMFASVAMGYIFWSLMRMEPWHARLGLVVFMSLLSPTATAYGLWQGWFLGLFFMIGGYCLILLQNSKQDI